MEMSDCVHVFKKYEILTKITVVTLDQYEIHHLIVYAFRRATRMVSVLQ